MLKPKDMGSKFIYWNTKKIADIARILDIALHEKPDIFFLAETNAIFLEIEEKSLNTIGYEYFPNPGCERVKILKKKIIEIELGLQTNYYTAVKIKNLDTTIISVHFPSLMFQHMDSLKEVLRDFRTNIDIEIGDSLDTKIVIIGDFNVNPFEKPMIDFDGFRANNSPNSRMQITNLGKTRSSYYNPTWLLYSRAHFPGTKYFKRPSGSSHDILEFHYLDQVIISQCLREQITEDEIKIIEATPKFLFLDPTANTIEGSDHLPLSYQFKMP